MTEKELIRMTQIKLLYRINTEMPQGECKFYAELTKYLVKLTEEIALGMTDEDFLNKLK